MLTDEIRALSAHYKASAIEIRRMLHTMPETEFNEFKTSGYIASVLDTLSIPYRRGFAGGTGIVAMVSGRSGGRTVAIRADMDALPITEATGLEFKSKTDGVMHACGHDAHIAIALASAFILNELRDNFKGNVKFFFQPAEEGDGGAELMIKDGVLDSPAVDVCIGGHVMPDYPVGKVVLKKGPLLASPDNFEITLTGVGGHGAYPEKCKNPIDAAAAVISALGQLTDRSVPRVVSVCEISGGASPNVIPESVKISGTARTFTAPAREEISYLIGDTAKKAAADFGVGCNYRFIPLFPALINDDTVIEMFKDSASRVIGAENVIESDSLSMTGDDFSYFARAVPSAYVHIGCKNEAVGAIYPLHHNKFTVDEDCIAIAAECYAQFAVDYLDDFGRSRYDL